MQNEKRIKGLFDFIKSSPSALHAVDTVKKRLLSEGYTELFESEAWQIAEGGKYFVIRNGTSLIAFRAKKDKGFMICATHSDSPAFRVKTSGAECGAYVTLPVERYGGMILYSWFDRPLSIAGRVVLKTDEGIKTELLNIDRDLLVIPSVAIHLNRSVNEKFSPNPALDLIPLFAGGEEKRSLNEIIAAELGAAPENVVSHDLFLYVRDGGKAFGLNGEFVLAPRLDDLGCVYASLEAFLAAADSSAVPVFALFDNEEVGSETKQGAASGFLSDALLRITGGGEKHLSAVASSFMVSADNAHAKHPNHPELSDARNAPLLNGGVVIKYNANQKYATDGISAAVFEIAAERRGVKIQKYYNRADMPGGSTLGSISNTRVSVSTVDVGLAQLAMHSAVETAGAQDISEMIEVLSEIYSSSLRIKGGEVILEK